MKTSPIRDLRSAIAFLEEQGDELLHIRDEISLKYELASIAENLYGGPALFFDNVAENSTPVVANMYSRKRIARLFGVDEKGLIPHVVVSPISDQGSDAAGAGGIGRLPRGGGHREH